MKKENSLSLSLLSLTSQHSIHILTHCVLVS